MSNTEMDEFIEKVRERSDIYSVVSRYVPMTLKGGRYWACCPFHGEKTASFSITPEKGLFYCFGCHEGGNVFNFISKIENISYFDAVKLQAERLGISLPTQNKSKAELEKENREKILFKINELARDFYHDFLLNTQEGSKGRKYLDSRGITSDTIKNFKLGYAPNSWDNLMQNLLNRGFSIEQLFAAGVVSKQKNGEKFFDRMRGRIIIPITDIFGHVVGFGGRILNDSEQKDSPKYLNTSETAVFNKGKLLFGLDKANKAVFSKKFVIIVEGYMDAISLASAGIDNVVATLGTAFTEDHAKLLSRYTRRIIFCYDSDEAGQRATMRALPIAEKIGANISVITVPDGKDPDEFVRKHGKEKFSQLINNALSIFDYQLQYFLKHIEHSTTAGKIEVLKNILPVVVNFGDNVQRSEYCKKISRALMLDENAVAKELSKVSSDNVRVLPEKVVKIQPKNSETPSAKRASEMILRMIWHECDNLSYVLAVVPKEAFSEIHREIIDYLEKCFNADKRPDDISAAAELSKAANAEIARILLAGSADPRDEELSAFQDSVLAMKKIWLKKIYNETLKQANSYLPNDYLAYMEKMQETFKIKEEVDKLRN